MRCGRRVLCARGLESGRVGLRAATLMLSPSAFNMPFTMPAVQVSSLTKLGPEKETTAGKYEDLELVDSSVAKFIFSYGVRCRKKVTF